MILRKLNIFIFISILIVAFCPAELSARNFFWEHPVRLSSGDSRFPKAVSNGNAAAVIWQEIDSANSRIYLSGEFMKDGKWISRSRFAGPFHYSGEIPDIYSVAMNDSGLVTIGVLSDDTSISIFTTGDYGENFFRKVFKEKNESFVAPRIYSLSDGGFMIFTSLGKDESFSILYSRSYDGYGWNDFSPFTPSAGMKNPFLPVVASDAGGIYILFQAQYNTGSRFSYQIYFTKSADGIKWTAPVLMTGDRSMEASSLLEFSDYYNQRPSIYTEGDHIYAAWERHTSESENARIIFAELDRQGNVTGRPEDLTRTAKASRPILFSYEGLISLVWFDTRKGKETPCFAQRNGFRWDEVPLPSGKSDTVFIYPLITGAGKDVSFIWQTDVPGRKNSNAIFRLSTDTTVSPPSFKAVSFTKGKRSRNEKVKVNIVIPDDSSGIRGYSWVWTKNPDEEVPHKIMALAQDAALSAEALTEGEWFLKASVLDYAGNWSEPGVISYFRDLTPPLPPVINIPALDAAGFLSSNSFSVTWQDESEGEDIAGFSWKLQKQYDIPSRLYSSKRHPLRLSVDSQKAQLESIIQKNPEDRLRVQAPASKIMTEKTQQGFVNEENGAYTFAVRSFDSAGNISKPSYITVYLNKYEPSTRLTSVKKSSDIFGNTALELNGKGFLYDGKISEVRLIHDKNPEKNIVLRLSDGAYRISNDGLITGIKLDTLTPEGNYGINLFHTDRGLFKSKSVVSIIETGTVKITEEYRYIPSWQKVIDTGRFIVKPSEILLAAILILACAGIVFSIHGITVSVKEGMLVKQEIYALITGDIMPLEKKKKTKALKRKGITLKVKLVSFTVFLVLMVSLLVSIPLGFIMIRTQEKNLGEGLRQRSEVLLESLSTGVRAYMPRQDVLELSNLPSQKSALEEAEYVTITGLPADDDSDALNFLWATNDPDFESKLDDKAFVAGKSSIADSVILEISSGCESLNEKILEQIGTTADDIVALQKESDSLRSKEDAKERRQEIARTVKNLSDKIDETVKKFSKENTSSYPYFNAEVLDRSNTHYIFYRPVIYRQQSSRVFVRSIVFMSVSTDSLIKSLDEARNTIIYTSLIITVVAILIGAIGSIILASVITNPIRRLERHVMMIANTAKKETLMDKMISIKTRDEIGYLGESVNEMTRSIAKSAQEEKLTMEGKSVQQAFLPLEKDGKGNIKNTAVLKDAHLECFGYYEGASGVSGDYFDYKKLDENRYVIIKSDASGHGVPAAFIMTVVATLFRKYYENWSYKANGVDLSKLVLQINDFIESLGMKGKFATLILAMVDTKSGDVYLCNAGDNVVHIFDSSMKKQKVLTLSETPAAGPLPSFMVEMKGGFKIEKTHINPGDVLFLYTDGIEESTRKFRNGNFEVIKCDETDGDGSDRHGNHNTGTETEQLENERISDIIEAVLNRRVYRLEKYHNPIPGEVLEFDFSTCSGTVEEAILALASVEKVFRFVKAPDAADNDIVRADKKIDSFLKEHFNRYDFYCSRQLPVDAESNYIQYTNVTEDDQLDDLTLVAIQIH